MPELAHDDLSSLAQRGHTKTALALVGMACDELGRALEAHSDKATRDLREMVLTALGPDLTNGQLAGVCRALDPMRDCLSRDSPSR